MGEPPRLRRGVGLLRVRCSLIPLLPRPFGAGQQGYGYAALRIPLALRGFAAHKVFDALHAFHPKTAKKALETSFEALGSNAEAIGTSIEALGSNSEALGTSIEALGSNSEALGTSIEALGSNIEAVRRASDFLAAASNSLGQTCAAVGEHKSRFFLRPTQDLSHPTQDLSSPS